MNPIQIEAQINFYLDLTRSPRRERLEYDVAFNNAIRQFIEKVVSQGFQKDQSISDDLYTLQKTQSAAPTADVALYPADYLHLTSLYATIGEQIYCRPTTQNMLGVLKKDTYRKPSDTKPYYTQELTGFKIHHGAGSVTTCELNYLKTPNTFSIGTEDDLIDAGTGVLASGASYIATTESVQNGISYYIGDTFTASGVDLTSGQVVPASAVTACDLPIKTHETLCQAAAKILSGTVQDFDPSAFAEKQSQESDIQ